MERQVRLGQRAHATPHDSLMSESNLQSSIYFPLPCLRRNASPCRLLRCHRPDRRQLPCPRRRRRARCHHLFRRHAVRARTSARPKTAREGVPYAPQDASTPSTRPRNVPCASPGGSRRKKAQSSATFVRGTIVDQTLAPAASCLSEAHPTHHLSTPIEAARSTRTAFRPPSGMRTNTRASTTACSVAAGRLRTKRALLVKAASIRRS